MARPPTSATQLVRLLNSVQQPIYVLDDEWRILLCNQACLRWLGRNEEDLLGVRCAYHSSTEVPPGDAVAAGLCPPPGLPAGCESLGSVCGPRDRRRARFVPLGPGEGPAALLVLVDPTELAESDAATQRGASADEPAGAELHQRLQRWRRQWAGLYRFDRLLGEGLAMRRARAQAELAAQCRASVLIVGAPGSGRQHLAATIHQASGSDAAVLIPLACAVLNPELLQSTVRALAFRQSGQSAGGVLLLNDVDQLSAEAQGELVAWLTARPFPLRLIATARQSLLEMAAAGTFRAELAAALTTIVIELPPLIQRREDLPLLAQLFLEDLNARGERQLAGFSAEALDRLDAHPWPGNLDELARVVAEAHRQAEGAEIKASDLPARLQLAADALAHPRHKEEPIVLDEFLRRIERELIQRALKRSKGNKAKAARLLGLTRPRLYRRMVLLGLEEAD